MSVHGWTWNRRDVLAAALWLAASRCRAPASRLREAAAEHDDSQPNLVVIQLNGGNDGLSTVVPYADDGYARNRNVLRLEPVPIDDYRGFNPLLPRIREMYEGGQLGIVEGVGIPDGGLSHFKAFEVWHAADPRGRASGDGWLGKLCAALDPDGARSLVSLHIGDQVPYSLHSSTGLTTVFDVPARFRWYGVNESLGAYLSTIDAEPPSERAELRRLRGILRGAFDSSARLQAAVASYRTDVEYPDTEFGRQLYTVAALIEANLGLQVFSLDLKNFDTHHYQSYFHGIVMQRLDGGLGAFLRDLQRSAAGRNTLVLAFSEFGRRVEENLSGGTDHGTAGPVFLFGNRVRPGLHGRHPSLTELVDGNLEVTVDFRSIYASVLEGWFGLSQAEVIGTDAPLLPLVG